MPNVPTVPPMVKINVILVNVKILGILRTIPVPLVLIPLAKLAQLMVVPNA